jgi:dehydrogenase/reductase SDR family member 1
VVHLDEESTMSTRPLAGRIALVTGGTRGLGKGIALELAHAGATVYVTGRTRGSATGDWPGSLDETVAAIEAAGGTGVGIVCDHTDDEQVRSIFERIRAEAGRLDLLVNNAYAPAIASGRSEEAAKKSFWELPIDAWDRPIDVGLRSHYVAIVLAMPLLLESKGLVVNVSSSGAYAFFNSVPYGVGKAGGDRMMRDMVLEIGDRGVSIVSVWPGLVGTERISTIFTPAFATALIHRTNVLAAEEAGVEPPAPIDADSATADDLHAITETPAFVGRAVVALAADPAVASKSGRPQAVVALAEEYGFTDVDGRRPDAFGFLTHPEAWPPLHHHGR